MDFKSMMRRVNFGPRPDVADPPAPQSSAVEAPDSVCPAPLLAGSCNRRFAALREAAAILEALPGPGEALHAIMSGRYDLTDLIEVILSKRGKVRQLRVATLSFNQHNVKLLTSWIGAGAVETLTLLCSEFFRAHNPETFEELRQVLASGGAGHRLAAARNDCKVVCLDFADGGKLVMEGSANLRTNSNREQFCLVADAALHDWHAAWIDAQVLTHESKESTPKKEGDPGRDRPAN